MIESDHHPSLHVDFGKFIPKSASYVNYLFASVLISGPSMRTEITEWMHFRTNIETYE